MLSQSRMNDATVEEDLGGICDIVKLLQGAVELVIVVVAERRHPRLDFLSSCEHSLLLIALEVQEPTCFKDIVAPSLCADPL